MMRAYSDEHTTKTNKRRFLPRGAMPLTVLLVYALFWPVEIFDKLTPSLDEDGIHRSVAATDASDLYIGMPSQKRICRIILDERTEQPVSATETYQNLESNIIIEEYSDICVERKMPTLALSQMFVMEFLSRQSRAYGIDVEYRHNCQQWPSYNNSGTTIQQWIPSPMEYPDDFELMDLQDLYALCEEVLADQGDVMDLGLRLLYHDLHGNKEKQSTENEQREGSTGYSISILDSIIPVIRLNFQTAVSQWSSYQDNEGKSQTLYQWLTSSGASHPTDNDSLNQGSAVTSIECFGPKCNDAVALPFYMYATAIPSFVDTIDILVPQACIDNIGTCHQHSEDVRRYLTDLYPRATVSIVIDNPASMNFMRRKVQAEILMCGPGLALDCLFPSLVRDIDVHGDERIIILEEGGSVSDELKLSYALDRISPQWKTHIFQLPSPMRTTLNQKDTNTDSFKSTLYAQPPQNSCHRLRGKVGSWVKDMDFAPNLQYDWYLHHRHGWADKGLRVKILNGEETELKYLPSTTYRWVDNISGNSDEDFCEVSLVTLEGICSTLQLMGIERLFFLGDSLQYQQVQSLWMILKQDRHGPEPNIPPNNLRPNFKHTVSCPDSGFEFDIEYVRNDQLIENEKQVSMEPGSLTMNCKNICFPWTSNYASDPRRTLLVVNTGPHFQDDSKFQAKFDHFIKLMQVVTSRRRVEDIILFRTSVAGHKGCDAPGLVPHENYESFINGMDSKKDNYGWLGFAKYNDYATRVVEKIRWDKKKENIDAQDTSEREEKNNFRIEILDVSSMTVLRQDGHLGDEFRPLMFKKQIDCLHYSLPGPVDWWNHLMFSNLVDIANEEYVEKKKTAAS